jgi:hypothetical protein
VNLDDKITAFLAAADAKAARSKLEPFADLIRQLRQRRWTYVQIAHALSEQFGLAVHPTTVHAFVKVRSGKGKGVLTMSTPAVASVTSPKPVVQNQPARRRFNLDT